VLDPALLRPGRFDRQVVISNPDVLGREKILKVHVRKVPLAPDVDLKTIAKGTPGFSGADLMNLVNEAALMAARRSKRLVTQQEFEDAKDKVMMGAERRSLVMSDAEKRNTAYHEAGHAIVGLNVPGHDPIHKATIIPRGRALGMVMSLPEGDRHSYTREYCVSKLAMMFGGREAEIMKFGPDKVTNGATGDIQMATRLARSMIMEWGMSDKLGRVRYQGNEQEVFLGHSVAQSTHMSEETARLIDAEIRKLIEDGENEARRILTEKRKDWETLAEALLEYETLSGDEIRGLLEGKPPVRDSGDEPPAKASAVPVTKGRPKTGDRPDTGLEPQPQA
jgi:cell division protease FtsH